MPFDGEHRKAKQLEASRQLKIGVLGFGNFGQFLAARFVARGHRVLATSRSPYADAAKKLGVEFYQDANDFCEEHPDVGGGPPAARAGGEHAGSTRQHAAARRLQHASRACKPRARPAPPRRSWCSPRPSCQLSRC